MRNLYLLCCLTTTLLLQSCERSEPGTGFEFNFDMTGGWGGGGIYLPISDTIFVTEPADIALCGKWYIKQLFVSQTGLTYNYNSSQKYIEFYGWKVLQSGWVCNDRKTGIMLESVWIRSMDSLTINSDRYLIDFLSADSMRLKTIPGGNVYSLSK
jgi:hypothetical protein